MILCHSASKTMQAVCYTRAKLDVFSARLLPFLPEGKNQCEVFDQISQGMFSRNIELRTQFLTNKIQTLAPHFDQWINLCSGLDCRAFALQQLQNKKVIRIDHFASLELANSLFKKAKLHHPNSLEIAHDLIAENGGELCKKLQSSRVDPQKPTFVLWEGATYYLPVSVVEATLVALSSYFGNLILLAEFIDKDGYFDVDGQMHPHAVAAMDYLKNQGEPWIGFFQKETIFRSCLQLGFEKIEITDRSHVEK
ncbi:MAG TPA: class I SAM-dependent methyltransferase, partial [Chlamydiales bacterium]|nr:class I SAM-dependent methyltransferase [Chlamydiales bacterium]